jgi:hypothetical protein
MYCNMKPNRAENSFRPVHEVHRTFLGGKSSKLIDPGPVTGERKRSPKMREGILGDLVVGRH